MSGFFEPPPSPWPEQAEPVNPPPWTGRPQGPPLGAAVSGLLLARSEQAAVYVDHVDAYPEGFELEIRASTSVAYDELGREGDGPDVFGRHCPDVAVDPRVPLTWSVRSATLRTMRPWDRHPPWAHWAFYVIWGIAGTFGPMMLVVALLTRSTTGIWIGIALCLVWGGSLAADWLLVRRLQQRVDGWTPWSPPDWRWLRS